MTPWSSPERPEPPHAPADERAALDDRLDFHRATLLLKCGGLTAQQLADRAVPPSQMSLLGLVRHLSAVESWFHAYDGQPDHQFFCNYEFGAMKDFDVVAERADDDLAAFHASIARSRTAVAGLDLDTPIPDGDQTLRWVYLHMIEEYARHNGHADLLRERVDGATGE